MQKFERLARELADRKLSIAANRLQNLGREMYAAGELPWDLPSGPFELEGNELVYHHPNFDFIPGNRQIIVEDNTALLTSNESKLLYALSGTPNITVSSSALINAVWGDIDKNLDDSRKIQVANLIDRVRNIFNSHGLDQNLIETRRSDGYSLLDPSFHQIEEEDDESKPEYVYRHRFFVYYPERGYVVVNGEERKLTHKENLLFNVLARNENRGVSYRALACEMWDWFRNNPDADLYTRAVNVHVRRLREKISRSKEDQLRIIQTIRSGGYMLVDEDSPTYSVSS